MSVDKRHSTEDPLTEHDVAERLSNAMLRCWRILADVTEDPVLRDLVRHSRFLVVQPYQLIEALEQFDQETANARCQDRPMRIMKSR